MRQPSRPPKRPTWEASRQGRSKPPFNLWHKSNPPHFFFPHQSEQRHPPGLQPISWQRPRQRDIDPQTHHGQSPVRVSSDVSLSLKPISWQRPRQRDIDPQNPSRYIEKDNNASTKKRIYSSRRTQAQASLSPPSFFPELFTRKAREAPPPPFNALLRLQHCY